MTIISPTKYTKAYSNIFHAANSSTHQPKVRRLRQGDVLIIFHYNLTETAEKDSAAARL